MSTTDPEAQLARKGFGKETKLSYSAHVLMENRHGLCVDLSVADANPATERTEALRLLRRLRRRRFRPATVGGDKGYDTRPSSVGRARCGSRPTSRSMRRDTTVARKSTRARRGMRGTA